MRQDSCTIYPSISLPLPSLSSVTRLCHILASLFFLLVRTYAMGVALSFNCDRLKNCLSCISTLMLHFSFSFLGTNRGYRQFPPIFLSLPPFSQSDLSLSAFICYTSVSLCRSLPMYVVSSTWDEATSTFVVSRLSFSPLSSPGHRGDGKDSPLVPNSSLIPHTTILTYCVTTLAPRVTLPHFTALCSNLFFPEPAF